MTAEREGLAEEIAEVLLRHQRIPLYNSGPGRNRCVGCDNLHGETDGSNSPRHVAHLADALADLLAARDRRVRGEALREAAEAIEAQRDEHKAEDVADGCESRFCEGWLLGQTFASSHLRETAARIEADR